MAEGPCFGTLEDEDILGIGHKITDYGILRQLAYAGLKLKHHEVEPTVTNKQNDIQSAAHELLSKWWRKQNSREEAFSNLHAALEECQLQMLVDELTGKRDQEQHPKEVLKDEHIQQLSTKITNKGELSKLAYRGLKLESEGVESALSNNPSDIQSAAHKILKTWLQKQTKENALGALHAALQECGMKGLSDELTKGVDGSKGPSQLSQGRLQTIRKWTKESLLEKPFCTAKGKIWTEDPSDTPLDEVYTKLRLLGKIRTKDTVKTEELSDSKDVIVKLGKLSLDGLLQKQPKLSFTKDEVLQNVGPEAFELGLLMGTESDPLEEEQTQVYCFQHIVFQEFTAGKFVATLDMAKLREIFPSWEIIMKHQLQEVVKVACGLADTNTLLDFIYTVLAEYILRQTDLPSDMFDNDASFLKSLMKEIPDDRKFDPLYNRYVNYITADDAKIFVPSKIYIFGPKIMHQNVRIQAHSEVESTTAECLMKLEDEDGSEVLKILQKIGSFNQDVSISNLYWKKVLLPDNDDTSNLARETIKISTSITSIRTYDCSIPQNIYEEMVAQLDQCDKLQTLDLGKSKSMDIGKAVGAPFSLKELFLYDCEIPGEVYREIIQHLRKHSELEKIHLNGTKHIPEELGGIIPGMNSLKQFYANECYMGIKSVESVLTGLSKCHNLQDLQLIGNTLSNHLEKLFPNSNVAGFPYLNQLKINKTKLKKADIQVLSRAVYHNKLPQLSHLDLSLNQLTGILRSLLTGTGHPGFPCLRFISLKSTKLSRDDFISLGEAVDQNRMPQARYLCLSKNELSNMKREVMDLVTTCINKYEKLTLTIKLVETKLPESFIDEMKSACKETAVLIRDNNERY